jgi:hypothetical protein
VLARENYDSVLTKISAQVLSPAEKLAMDNTLTIPSATNPIVLKNDLATYIPNADLGEVRDSVQNFSSLPAAPNNSYGDLRAVMDDGVIYRWTGTSFTFAPADVDVGTNTITHTSHGMLADQAITVGSNSFLPSPLMIHTFYYVTNVTLDTFQLATSVGGPVVNITDQGSGTHRVVYDGYWSPFIHTGTLDHTQLNNQNGDPLYQHLTQVEKDTLLNQTHIHANKAILDNILSAGSGQIITVAERSRLPTPDQKAALAGTSGTPSASNPYVTNNDPRLNTVRNPYVTIGPPGTLASFQGIDFRPFSDALLAIDVGTASAVKAIEVLPGFYTLGGVYLQWSSQGSAIVIEAWTPGSATLSFQTFQAGIQALDYPYTGKGPLIIRGFTFELNDTSTSGILSQRSYTLIEDCVFRPGPTTAPLQEGITLQGDNSIIRRCRFEGPLATAIEIRAQGCRIEECTFNLTSPSAVAVSIPTEFFFNPSDVDVGTNTFTHINHGLSTNHTVTVTSTGTLPAPLTTGTTYFVTNATTNTFKLSATLGGSPLTITTQGTGLHYVIRGSHAFVDHCNFLSGQLVIGTGVAYNGIYNNYFSPTSVISDTGSATRYIENLPEEINQPYVGGTRTVGPVGSYADFRGSDQTPIVQALADPRCTDVVMLEGTYTINSTITVPQGKTLRGVTTDGVQLISTIQPIYLTSYTSLKSICIQSTSVPVWLSVSHGATGIVIDQCQLNSSGNYCLAAIQPIDLTVTRCKFSGLSGVNLLDSTRSYFKDNVFSVTFMPLSTNNCSADHISGNIFQDPTTTHFSPNIRGSQLLINGNHFLAPTVPTKIYTTTSVWSGNWPHPQANNDDGVDWLTLSLDRYIEPITDGCVRNELQGFGVISFAETTQGAAGTIPMALSSRLDQTSSPARHYYVKLWWTAPDGITTGNVKWQITVAFRNKTTGTIGASVTKTAVVSRTGLTARNEDSYQWDISDGFMLGGADPTHVAVIVERVGQDVADTMTSNAYLTEVQLTLPRD